MQTSSNVPDSNTPTISNKKAASVSTSRSDYTPEELELGTKGSMVVPQVSIDWYRSLPWWRLLSQSVAISWRASHILLATIAVFLTIAGWHLGSLIFQPEYPLHNSISNIRIDTGSEMALASQSTVPRVWSGFYLAPLANLSGNLSLRQVAYTFFIMLWSIAVWSFAGGLLARRSIMEMGVRSSVGWSPTFKLVSRRWLSMVWSITMPLVSISLIAILPFLLGVIARLGTFGQTVALIAMVPATLLVIAIGWTAAIAALGFSLSVCAIVSEKGADALDGLARASAYVFQRPMTLLTILVLAGGLGWISSQIMMIVLGTGREVIWSAFTIGYGGNINLQMPEDAGFRNWLLQASNAIIVGLGFGFLCSFFWTASAAAYLTLRWEIDHTDFDDLDLQELGEPIVLPKFQKDARGVAEVVDTNESTDVG